MAKRPIRYDFDIYAERTFRKKWRYRNPPAADGTPGDPVDLTDWHGRLVVPAGADADFLHLTDGDDTFPDGGLIVMGGLAGTFEWFMPDEVTGALDFPKTDYFFDLQDPAGDWLPYLRGTVRLWKVR